MCGTLRNRCRAWNCTLHPAPVRARSNRGVPRIARLQFEPEFSLYRCSFLFLSESSEVVPLRRRIRTQCSRRVEDFPFATWDSLNFTRSRSVGEKNLHLPEIGRAS